MSTAAAEPVEVPEVTVDETIRRTVRALRSAREADAAVLARHIGISRASLYNRLNGAAPFLAAEMAGLASFFGVPIGDFYEGIVRVGPHSVSPVTSAEYLQPERHLVVVDALVTDPAVITESSVVPNSTPGCATAAVLRRAHPERTNHLAGVA